MPTARTQAYVDAVLAQKHVKDTCGFQTELRDSFDSVFNNTRTITTQITTAGAATYTIAQMLEGVIDRDPNGAARSDVSPTAALIIAGLANAQTGTSFFFVISNAGAATEDITLTAGTGVTLVGKMVINDGEAGLFLCLVTSATTCTIIGLSGNT